MCAEVDLFLEEERMDICLIFLCAGGQVSSDGSCVFREYVYCFEFRDTATWLGCDVNADISFISIGYFFISFVESCAQSYRSALMIIENLRRTNIMKLSHMCQKNWLQRHKSSNTTPLPYSNSKNRLPTEAAEKIRHTTDARANYRVDFDNAPFIPPRSICGQGKEENKRVCVHVEWKIPE